MAISFNGGKDCTHYIQNTGLSSKQCILNRYSAAASPGSRTMAPTKINDNVDDDNDNRG